MLFNIAESKNDNVPRLSPRKAGDNKRRLDVEDIYGLCEFLDKERIKVPDFVARNLHRIPAIHPSDTDVVRLATTVCDLKKQLEDLRTVVSGITTKDSPPEQSTTSAVDVGSGENVEIGSDRSDGDAQDHTKLLYSELPVFRTKGDDGSWPLVTRKKKEAPRRLVGVVSNQQCAIKAVPRAEKSWHIFVGRLSPDTIAEVLTDFLQDAGVTVLKCWPLRVTEEWQKKFAAFHLVVKDTDKDKVFDDVQWPVDVDVRDWVFKS